VAPGEVCTASFQVENTGTLAALISLGTPTVEITEVETECTAADWMAEAVTTDNNSGSITKFPAGDIQTVTVTFQLKLEADNECQDTSAEVSVTVLVEQNTATPHSTDDTP
jgi:hypothetical protein